MNILLSFCKLAGLVKSKECENNKLWSPAMWDQMMGHNIRTIWDNLCNYQRQLNVLLPIISRIFQWVRSHFQRLSYSYRFSFFILIISFLFTPLYGMSRILASKLKEYERSVGPHSQDGSHVGAWAAKTVDQTCQ